MKHIFIALLSLIALSAQGQVNRSYAEGEQIKGLVIDGAFEVKLSQGSETGVWISGTEKDFLKLSVTVAENGVVNVSDGRGVGQYFKGKKPLVKIVMSTLDMLTIQGAASVLASGEFTAQELSSIEVSGTSFVEFLKVTAPKVVILGAGASKIAQIKVFAPSVKITTTGSCDATILGECDNAEISTSGSSLLNILMLETKHIEATCFGVSLVKATVNGTAKVSCGGTALFKYTGKGKAEGDVKPL